MHYPNTWIQDLVWDCMYMFTEPLLTHWPFNKLREKALQQSIKHMHYEDESSRYMTFACGMKVLQILGELMELTSIENLYA